MATLPGLPAVLHQDLPAGWSHGVVQAFEFEAGIDLLKAPIAILLERRGVHDVEAGGKNDGAHLHLQVLGAHAVVYGIALTGLDAFQAFRANHAVETLVSLRLGLFLGETQLDFLKTGSSLIHGNGRHLGPGLYWKSFRQRREILLRHGNGFATGSQVFSFEEPGNRDGGFFPLGHGADRNPGPGLGVTAGKDPFPAGGKGDGIGLDGSLAAEGQAFAIRQEKRIRRLPDGRDDPVRLDLELTPGYRYRTPPSRSIRLAQFHPKTLHAGCPAIPGEHLRRRGQILDFDALGQGVFNFVFASRHFPAGTTIEYAHLRGAQSRSHPCRIDGHITTADNDHFALYPGEVHQGWPGAGTQHHASPRRHPHREHSACGCGGRRSPRRPPGTPEQTDHRW